jgi:hypothetical protein
MTRCLETYTYNGALTGYQDLISLACDNNAFGTNGPSRVQTSGREIAAIRDLGGRRECGFGVAWLNYSLNTNANAQPQPPTLTSTPRP